MEMKYIIIEFSDSFILRCLALPANLVRWNVPKSDKYKCGESRNTESSTLHLFSGVGTIYLENNLILKILNTAENQMAPINRDKKPQKTLGLQRGNICRQQQQQRGEHDSEERN
eukprot:XP_014768489.1 PREDICTED: uncharacterized protein LOC106867935 [Octopus bimaculoides]